MPAKSPETARPDVFSFTVPIRTVNPLNGNKGGHWGSRKDKRDKERQQVGLGWCVARSSFLGRRPPFPPGPWLVTLTRCGPGTRRMDDDGCAASLKHVRDEIAARLGVDDGDTQRIRFVYAQRRGPWSVEIRIEGLPAPVAETSTETGEASRLATGAGSMREGRCNSPRRLTSEAYLLCDLPRGHDGPHAVGSNAHPQFTW